MEKNVKIFAIFCKFFIMSKVLVLDDDFEINSQIKEIKNEINNNITSLSNTAQSIETLVLFLLFY